MGHKLVILLALLAIGCETQKAADNTPYIKLGYGFAASVWAYQVYAVPESETPDKQLPDDTPDAGQSIGATTQKAEAPVETPPPITPSVVVAPVIPAVPATPPEQPITPVTPVVPPVTPVVPPVTPVVPPVTPVVPPATSIVPMELDPHKQAINDTPITPEFTAEPPPISEPAIKEREYRLLYIKGNNCVFCELFENGGKDSKGVNRKAYYKWLKDSGWTIGLDVSNHIQEINGDVDVGTRTKYNVESYPTFILIDHGKEIDRLNGYQTGEKIVDFYNKGKK